MRLAMPVPLGYVLLFLFLLALILCIAYIVVPPRIPVSKLRASDANRPEEFELSSERVPGPILIHIEPRKK